MLFRLLFLFTVVPIIELALLIRIGTLTEWWLPVMLVLVTGVLGAGLARWQGLSTLRRIQDELGEGRIPTGPLLDGLLILVGGALLITPGVITDLFGLSLLLPPTRVGVKKLVVAWFERRIRQGVMHVHMQGTHAAPPDQEPEDEPMRVRGKVLNAEDEPEAADG